MSYTLSEPSLLVETLTRAARSIMKTSEHAATIGLVKDQHKMIGCLQDENTSRIVYYAETDATVNAANFESQCSYEGYLTTVNKLSELFLCLCH